ncbi:MAG TPA: hypothetical protein VNM50_06705, partial [Chloroflexota bacterium]|nr:hypothetical protein [Chloroflexota bacterium]
LARAAGFPHVYTFEELATFEREIGAVLAAPGPTFITLRVTAPPLPRRLPRRRTKDALPEVWAALAQRARQA